MRRLLSAYRNAAVLLLNTVLLFVLANLLSYAVLSIREASDSGAAVSQPPEDEKLFSIDGTPIDTGQRTDFQLRHFDFTAYEGLVSERYAANVLSDFFRFAQRGLQYQPWVQFSEPPFDGELLHVDLNERGFPLRRSKTPRSTKRGDSTYSVFVFGGSTSFGYHVSDEHTWPSFLSDILNARAASEDKRIQVQVSNYGRGFYDLSQELLLFADLLKSGYRPNLAVFMDGVNLGLREDVPRFSRRIFSEVQLLQHLPPAELKLSQFDWLPLIRLLRVFANALQSAQPAQEFEESPADDESSLTPLLLNRLLHNKRIIRAIAAEYSVPTLFFLQPNAMYNYPFKRYRFQPPPGFLKRRRKVRPVYEYLRASNEFIDLSDLFSRWGSERRAIVDDVHYSPGFNQFLAQEVAAHIDLPDTAAGSPLQAAEATGIGRDAFNVAPASPIN